MIALYTGRRPISYSLSLTLSALAGFIWIILTEREDLQRRRIEGEGQKVPDPFLAGVSALASALIAARLGYIALHFDYYRLNTLESFYLWEGGLAGAAGGVGALIGLGLYALSSRGNFWSLGDSLAIPVQFVLLGSWAGCWFEGCAYGMPADINLLFMGTDPFGSIVQRWPTQGIGVILSVISFTTLTWVGDQETPAGLKFALSLTTGALGAAVIGLYRSDPVLHLGPARLDTWVYALLAALGLALLSNRLYSSRDT